MANDQQFGSPGPEESEATPAPSVAVTAPGANLGAQLAQIQTSESSALAVAVQAKAAVEARYLVAERRPRNWLDVGVKLNAVMRRPGVAEEAEYSLPRGGKTITGPTIRFAEEALRAAGNILTDVQIVQDDEIKRIVRINMTDLEANWTITRDVVLYKTMTRLSLKPGQVPLSARLNSEGKVLYVVEAPEEELLFKQNALVSRVMRTDGLRLIPTDVKDDAIDTARETRRDRQAKDPAGAAKRLAAKFYQLGVTAEALEAYIGKPLTGLVQVEAENLMALLAALREGDLTWEEAMEEKGARRTARKPGGPGGAEGLKAKLGGEPAITPEQPQ